MTKNIASTLITAALTAGQGMAPNAGRAGYGQANDLPRELIDSATSRYAYRRTRHQAVVAQGEQSLTC